MPVNITDAAVYHATIQTVADGDAATGANFALAPQNLADRTRYLKDHVDTAETNITSLQTTQTTHGTRLTAQERFAQYRVSGSAVAVGSKLTLSSWAVGGSFSLASNDVEVPEAGYYLVQADLTVIMSTSADYAIGLHFGGTLVSARRMTGPPSGTLYRPMLLSHIVQVSTPSTQKLDLRPVESTMTLHSDGGLTEFCTLTIRRLI